MSSGRYVGSIVRELSVQLDVTVTVYQPQRSLCVGSEQYNSGRNTVSPT